jgi:hypothetical protein
LHHGSPPRRRNDETIAGLGHAAEHLPLPRFADHRAESAAMMERALELIRTRLTSFAG